MKPTKTRLHTTGLTLAAGALALAGTMASADVVHPDDVIIQGSACVGFDCNNGENFGFDTIRMKENNLRLHFDDTSNSSSFPDNDWRLIANDTSNGGAEYLAIEDSTAGRQVFRVTAGARTNSIFVSSSGNVGFGTATPVVTLHARAGNTPTLRLEQDGSSGFTPQSWDLAGNEANFFVRDVTNGSQLPFRIKPGADTNSISIDADNDVGIGIQTANAAQMHVTNGSTTDDGLRITNTGSGNANLLRLENTGSANAGVAFIMAPANSGSTDFWQVTAAANTNIFRINRTGGGNEFEINQNGDLTITGSLTANAGSSNDTFPDYVFDPDYELMPLYEVEKFVVENRHLPRIPSAEEVGKNGLNMTKLQIALLEKVEELTLHTIAQQKTIDTLQERLEALAD